MLLKPLREHLRYNPNILAGVVCFIRSREKVWTAEWRPIAGFEGCAVSAVGQVLRRGKLAPWDVNSSLYPMVTIAPGVRRLVHVLVAEAFIGPCPAGHQVDHEDENTLNPSLTNLRYITHGQNVARQRRRRRPLSEAECKRIRKLIKKSSVHCVAAHVKVSTQTVRRVARDILAKKPGTVAKRNACS